MSTNSGVNIWPITSRLQTADRRLQTGGKMQTEGKMQTAECRLGDKMQTEGKIKYL